MKNWKVVLLAIVLIVPLYLAFTSLNIGVARANSTDDHESAEHKALESSPDHETLETKVPSGKLAEVRGLKNIVALDTKSLSVAKEIYNGKGTCVNCHGEKGRGDGEIASSFSPPPRNFTYAKWQNVRTDGEIFWVITNGTESGMPPFEDMLSDEEKWELVNYIREIGKAGGVASKSN